jgi:hypothetical protein
MFETVRKVDFGARKPLGHIILLLTELVTVLSHDTTNDFRLSRAELRLFLLLLRHLSLSLMFSSNLPAGLSAEERQYYVSTAMLTAAFKFDRDGSNMWWLTFLPAFVS